MNDIIDIKCYMYFLYFMLKTDKIFRRQRLIGEKLMGGEGGIEPEIMIASAQTKMKIRWRK